jgi:peptidyl-prolyl cis-trans isomerase C
MQEQEHDPGIDVNGVKISREEINAEVQYHPAESLDRARHDAMKALVIKELLIQRAVEAGLSTRAEALKDEDGVIDALLDREIEVPPADEETCRRYYEQNKARFFTPPLFEASHILYMAPPDDEAAKTQARERAQAALERIKEDPAAFETIARAESACTSAKDGGRLGQVSRGQTMPDFEAALFRMQEGEVSAKPVETKVGYHIVKVHKRIDGRQLPFEAVSDRIAQMLSGKSWDRAFNQYIQLLIGRSRIDGFRLEGAQTPLVQ